jgi:dTDP-4-dehydrorhamnose reductase
VGNLAQICKQNETHLVHISTDYVFNGSSSIPYKEDDAIDPINTYGSSKLKGEELAFINNPSTLVIRTSWVYSSYGNNFVKTMVRLMNERENIKVVNDQYGCPTYAADLAEVILKIIDHSETKPLSGILNYCNSGVVTWYQFALAIKEIIKSNCTVTPIPSSEYITPAKRPHYSVLDTTKIRELLALEIPYWKDSLEKCLSLLG